MLYLAYVSLEAMNICSGSNVTQTCKPQKCSDATNRLEENNKLIQSMYILYNKLMIINFKLSFVPVPETLQHKGIAFR